MEKSTIIELVLFAAVVYMPLLYSYSTVIHPYDNSEWRDYAENTVSDYVDENYPVEKTREVSENTNLTYLQTLYVMYHLTSKGELRDINGSYYPSLFNISGQPQRELIMQESIRTGFQRR